MQRAFPHLTNSNRTEHIPHHAHQFEGARIADAVEHAVGIFVGGEYAFVSQDGEVLRDVALRRPNLLDDVLYAQFARGKNAQYLEAQRVGDGFHGVGGGDDIFFSVDQFF